MLVLDNVCQNRDMIIIISFVLSNKRTSAYQLDVKVFLMLQIMQAITIYSAAIEKCASITGFRSSVVRLIMGHGDAIPAVLTCIVYLN